MTIRSRLITQAALLQIASLLLLSYGVVSVQRALGEREVLRAETLLKHAVARTATDALIQKDQVQLLSYLNFLKAQYPALAYAHVVWHKGTKTTTQNLGAAPSVGRIDERRVRVSDPSMPDSIVEISFGVDRDVLREPILERQRMMLKVLLWTGSLTALLGLSLAVFLSRSLTTSLVALSRVAEQISEGHLGVRLEWESDDEIGALVRVFNGMSTRLADLDIVKKNFVSSVTHELRSPLGAIESFLPLIREKISAGEKQGLNLSLDYLDRIAANVQRLNRFITDLLDVAKIEQGRMECVLRPLALGPLAAEAARFFEAKALAQGVVVENMIDGVPPVLADADRVRQVLINLLANALKFTPSGGKVRLEAEQVRDAAGRWVEVTVADTGRGMSDADRGRLFQAFTQGTNVNEGVAGHKGTGLGLYIVKSIVAQHGGRVEMKSEPGNGSRFTFSLRVAG
ncbi:MAG TPA: hypothetical protein DCZ01_07960 [Elusimicrobia bacterium]|nr:MAG: hypothetical protein A2X37_06115 [Elusimicrobia bacterium GWA2_66_18]OGR68564.1 MAG: hypothetical protein A2X40_12470 [Elusimicrobia bacterium GWC2_65_9]HAZ08438.1 hypothetical protein [Elusimicrobiota bacterium]